MSDDNTQQSAQSDDNQSSRSTAGKQFQNTVVVDQDTCIGCGVCAALCPQAYEMSAEDGKSYVTKDANHDDPVAKEAEAACPVNAITVQGN